MALCAATPVHLLLRSADAGGARLLEHLRDPDLLPLLLRSAGLALAVAAGTVALGVPLAWITVHHRLRAQPVWLALLAAPLAIPSYVGAQVLIYALGPGGLVRAPLEDLGLPVPFSPYGFAGATLVLVLLCYPYVMLPVRAALLRLPASLEDGARALGESPWGAFRRVILPLLRPAAAGGALLAGLYALSDFGAVSMLRLATFTEVIYGQISFDFDRTGASLNAVLLMGVAALLLVGERRLARHPDGAGGTPEGAGTTRRPLRGTARFAAGGFATGVIAAAAGVPVLVLGAWSLRGGWTTDTLAETARLAGSSAWLAAVTAAVVVAAALPVAWLVVRHRGRLASLLERVCWTGHALPGIVVALAFVALSVRTPLYQGYAVLVAGYLVLFLPQALASIRATLARLDPTHEEAARALGRTPAGAFREVVLPRLRPGLVAGALLVLLTTLKELPATLLLGPSGYRSLAVRIWSLESEVYYARAAVHSLTLLALAGAVLFLLLRTARGPRGLAA